MLSQVKKNSEKIRVLISGHLPPPIGGMGTYYQLLLNSSLAKYINYRFVQTSSQKRNLANSGRFTIVNLASAIRDCAKFTQAILSFRPQVAHIGTAFGLSFLKNSYCVLLARLLRKKVLLHPHCSLSYLYTDRSKSWQWFFRQVIRWTDGIVVLSNEWLQLKKIIPDINVYLLPNAINPTDFLNIYEHRISYANRNSPISILYLGYLGKAKGTFDLIEAVQLILDRGITVSFNLVGSELTPGEMELIKQKIATLTLQKSIKLFAPVLGDEKLTLFENADIFIYPSYHEGIPMAVLEAMASGLPIIATKVGGLPDLVKDDINGVMVNPGHPNELADAICFLLQNKTRRLEMGKNSRQFVVEKFNIDQHISKLTEIYSKVCG